MRVEKFSRSQYITSKSAAAAVRKIAPRKLTLAAQLEFRALNENDC